MFQPGQGDRAGCQAGFCGLRQPLKTTMEAHPARFGLRQVPVLLRGEPEAIAQGLEHWEPRSVLRYVAVIVAGAGLYGAAMGCWRAPAQALYTAIKFPLVILLTTLGNSLLNGMLAPLLGLNLRFRQSLLAILMSFTIATAILGAFSPVVFFLDWNLPPMSASGQSDSVTFSFIKVVHVVIIAFAGVVANLRLGQLLRHISGRAEVGRNVLVAWLAGNLLLGSQLCWILRPFFGAPYLEVQFLRPNPLQGNFFETVFSSLCMLLFS
jgi:hypothetical protein